MKTFILCNFETFVFGAEKPPEAAPNVAPRLDPTGMGEVGELGGGGNRTWTPRL